MRVVVLGAGIQGSLTALALARRGKRVCVFEKHSRAMSQASRWNEGKIHLGFVFANDKSMQSARTMIEGAFLFQPIVENLSGIRFSDDMISDTFIYARHVNSLLSADELEKHYRGVQKIIDETLRQYPEGYLGHKAGPVFRALDQTGVSANYDPEFITHAWSTVERAVDPGVIADAIIEALEQEPLVELLYNCKVTGIKNTPEGAFEICIEGENQTRRFSHVVNSLWDDRLGIDRCLGKTPDRAWLYRHKFAIHSEQVKGTPPPSTTLVLGPFGDVVSFGNGHYYLSWYPVCCTRKSSALIPPPWKENITVEEQEQVFASSIENLIAIMPGIGALEFDFNLVEVEGGTIFTWGNNDITDLESEIHQRFRVGVQSFGNYHTIDTGKYTTAPMFAEQAAQRICGEV